MYDLLLNYPQGLSVGEISSILPISKIMGIESTGMNERGQVGMTAMAFKKTFSLSEPSNRGIVQILPGMPRPTGPMIRLRHDCRLLLLPTSEPVASVRPFVRQNHLKSVADLSLEDLVAAGLSRNPIA
ncbi:unnamed protein product, partial [Nippostrongylus brasiliensis]|uniref:General secretion pathway protein C n=1 Tax=Nippostrongylus brasiliensis TaxID=27835 RepID=A0A0N4XMT7_NIPBR